MNNRDEITAKQLYPLMFVCLLSPAIRLLPVRSVQIAGKSAWLSPVFAAIFGAALVITAKILLSDRRDGEGLLEIIVNCFGRRWGRVVLVFFAMWFVLYSGFMMRVMAERMISAVYENGKPTLFMLSMLAISLIAASGSVKALARTGQIFAPIIIMILIAVIAFAVKDVRADYLLPISSEDVLSAAKGALPVADIMSGAVFFLFLAGNVKKDNESVKQGAKWLGAFIGTVFAISAVTIGALSSQFVSNSTSPFFLMIRNVIVFGIVERIEAVIITLWVLSDFLYLSTLFLIAKKQVGIVLGAKNDNAALIFIAAVSFAVGMFVSKSRFGLNVYSEKIIPAVSMGMFFAVVPIILIVNKVRKNFK